ncbi:MAG: RdgB/HAM1 family non-canonical purine NTP pyrophosphatase [Pseudomonadales bacterium]|jgi:XTP/dITP diphosphohydrolase|nr:RdgB/HAM1 family non-canonical purine NTP pyrophosphatase [Pseudomonadales bacterium]
MDLVLATRNQGKVDEMRPMLEVLGLNIINQADTDIPSPVEDGATFVENALIKARAVALATGLPSIADDSGLVVPTLDGAPGIFSARYAGPDATDAQNNQKLLSALAEQSDRSAHFFCCMVFLKHADDPTPLIASGRWPGEILMEPRGQGGFGYDPLFWLPDQGKSAAELSKETKNKISHRGRACATLLQSMHAQLASH